MRKLILFFLCLVILVPAAAYGQAESSPLIRVQRPNLVGGELGGRALLYSLNYERFLGPKVALGAGFMGFGVEEGGVFLIPMYVTFVPVGNVHALYLSGGYTWAAVSNWDEVESSGYGTAAIGYLYQSETGFFVRPAITMNFRPDAGFLMLPGIALGGSF